MNGENKKDDMELVKAFKEGHKEVFDELMENHSPKLYRFACSLLGNHHDAEEVVQDAFIRAYNGLNDFRGDSSFETWMYRITMNLARNKFHWNHRRGEGLNISLSDHANNPNEDDFGVQTDLDLPDESHSPERLMEKMEQESNVFAGLNQLPDFLRDAMILRHVKNMPYEQIASILNCKIGTVKSRISRGRELLREYLVKADTPVRTGA